MQKGRRGAIIGADRKGGRQVVKDMTAGSPARLILSFSLPLLVGNIFQQLYNMVDAMVVGRFIGTGALAAVGSTGAISFLVLGFVIGLTGGFSVVTAQRFGADDQDGLRQAVAISFYIGAGMTVVLTAVSVLLTHPLLRFMDTPPDIYADAYTYIVIIFAGSGATVFYNLVSGVLRALGDSRTPLYFLILSSLINVGLDLLFIIPFQMGVAGAAYATVIAQVVSGLLCLLYMLRRYPILKLRRDDWRLRKSWCVQHLKLGLPMALQFSITAVGIIVLQKALNSFGSNTIAAYTAASKVEQLATQPLQTLGITMATYCGQNLGAGRIDRIRRGVVRSVQICVVCCLACGLLVVFGGRFFVGLFLEGDQPAVVEQAQQYLNTIAGFLIVLGLLFIFRNALQGMGSTLVPMLAGAAELVVRVLMAFLLPAVMGYAAICIAGPAAWVGATIPLIVCYLLLMRRLRSVRPEKKPEETAP